MALDLRNIAITRPKNIFFSLFILFGAIYQPDRLDFSIDYGRILLVVLIFQLLYSGIYTLNDILDRRTDALDEFKKTRPIPSGRLSVFAAVFICIGLIVFSLIFANIYDKQLFYWELIFLVFNIIYSLILKKVPYLDFLSNGLTHSLRFVMGHLLFGGTFSEIAIPAIIFYLTITIYSAGKRLVELRRKKSARTSLKYYSSKKIKYSVIILFTIVVFLYLITIKTSNLLTNLMFLASLMGMVATFNQLVYSLTIKRIFSKY